MKKILTLTILTLLLINSTAIANEWVEVYYKTYVKLEKLDGDNVFYWAKYLNDGSIKPIANKKVHFQMSYEVENCADNSSATMASYFYGLNGSVLSSYVSPFYSTPRYLSFSPVIPQSIGEALHKYACENSY